MEKQRLKTVEIVERERERATFREKIGFIGDAKNIEKGITLVALVITIIIIIILSTITLNATFGDNGLIKQASEAKDRASNMVETEGSDMNSLLQEYANVMAEDKEMHEEVKTKTVAEAKESGEVFEENTTLVDDFNNEVNVPGGFHVSSDSGTKIEEGVVIEDSNDNQFVWIPVGNYQTSSGEKTNNLARRMFTSSGATEVDMDGTITISSQESGHYLNGTFYGGNYSDSDEYDTIEAYSTSATNNNGYYIGRYEQGTGNVCKSGVETYSNISYANAKEQSETMYSGNKYLKSELISSYGWDTALNFICQNSSYGYTLATTTDSKYGNINTGTRKATGVDEADNYSNIHDIIGNFSEWTTEYVFASDGNFAYHCVNRGGNYNIISTFADAPDNSFTANYAADRGITLGGIISYVGFRVQMYLL